MKKVTTTLFYSLLFIFVIFIGLMAGRHISNISKPLTTEEMAQRAEDQAIKEQRKEAARLERELKKRKDKSDYIAALPSYGPIIKIHRLDVIFQEKQAVAFLDENQMHDLKIGQKVVLYDDQEYALPLGGMIKNFAVEQGKIKINISLPEDTNIEYLSPRVGVITLETIASQRIPLQAIQKDKDGNDIIWLANTNENGLYTLTPKAIKKNFEDTEFFEASQTDIEATQLIILNPDKYIREGTEYDVFITQLNAPLHNPIKQAWVEYEIYRFEQDQQALIKRAEDCAKGVKEPQTGDISLNKETTTNVNAVGCSAANADDVMLRVFQSLTTQPNQTQGACGTSACGQ